MLLCISSDQSRAIIISNVSLFVFSTSTYSAQPDSPHLYSLWGLHGKACSTYATLEDNEAFSLLHGEDLLAIFCRDEV